MAEKQRSRAADPAAAADALGEEIVAENSARAVTQQVPPREIHDPLATDKKAALRSKVRS